MDLFSVNAYHIKPATDIIPISMPDKIKQRNCTDRALFFFPDCCKRASAGTIFSIFYFDKYQIFPITGNEIDLAFSAAEIPLKNT